MMIAIIPLVVALGLAVVYIAKQRVELIAANTLNKNLLAENAGVRTKIRNLRVENAEVRTEVGNLWAENTRLTDSNRSYEFSLEMVLAEMGESA